MQEQLPRRTESEPRSVQTPAPARLPVSVVVPVKNEERNLGRCLAALTRFSEVIVVDSGSTDATPQIARNHGATLLQFVWDGAFPKKRNWVLLNHRFATDWVLFLDADEIVSEAFCEEVEQAIRSSQHNGYWLNYSNHFLGRRLKYGVPQKKLALFRVGSGLYERIQEASWSKLDMEVHEHPIIEGPVGEIGATIEHNDFQGLGKFIDRHRDYAIWEANRVLLLRREEILRDDTLTKRQTFKYRNIDRWWFAWFYFAYTYILKRGFLDGVAGFYYAFYKAWYFLSIRLLIAELHRQ
jgi:glycosyltransferase involved in cell wall biosynthesis